MSKTAVPANGDSKGGGLGGPLITGIATVCAALIGAYALFYKSSDKPLGPPPATSTIAPAPIPTPVLRDQPLEIEAKPFFVDFAPRASGGPRRGTACSEFRDIVFPNAPYDFKVGEEFTVRYDAAPLCVGQGFRDFDGTISWTGDQSTKMIDNKHNDQFPGIFGSIKVKFSKPGSYNVVANLRAECVDVGLQPTACTARGATVIHIR
jgi:hypothetical protein